MHWPILEGTILCCVGKLIMLSSGAVTALQVHPVSDHLLLIGYADGMVVEWGTPFSASNAACVRFVARLFMVRLLTPARCPYSESNTQTCRAARGTTSTSNSTASGSGRRLGTCCLSVSSVCSSHRVSRSTNSTSYSCYSCTACECTSACSIVGCSGDASEDSDSDVRCVRTGRRACSSGHV